MLLWINRVGREGWTMNAIIADFQFLLYLTEYLGIHDDIPLLCRSAIDKTVPLDDGYQLLLRSIAGMS